MSDPYLRSFIQKYRLAVAIGILKEKPKDVSIEDYIKELNRKLNNDKTDDLDVSVCSDDFDMEENAAEIDTNTNIVDEQTNINNNVTILENYNVQLNLNKETAANTPKSNDVSQIPSTLDPDATFCETQDENIIYSNLSQVYINKDIQLNQNTENKEMEFNLQREVDSNETYYDSQLTEVYSVHGFTQNNTHISQSQNYDNLVVINDKFINAKNPRNPPDYHITEIGSIPNTVQRNPHTVQFSKRSNRTDSTQTILIETNESGNQIEMEVEINESFPDYDSNKIHLNENNDMLQKSTRIDEHSIFTNTTGNQIVTEINESFPQYTPNTIQLNKDDSIQKPAEITENSIFTNETGNQIAMDNESFLQYAQNLNETDISVSSQHKISENTNTNEDLCNGDNNMNEYDGNANTEVEIVSFKVIEELNKIKNYINKRVERRLSNDGSIESGYRSDSQSRCCFKSSLQQSGNSVNQSAHCLYEYITQCPLLGTTHEIIEEISQVLGQLIDRLHDEEKYPSFLDELLENVNLLLQDLFKENGVELLKKEENIQRLLLLNKSVHIQKYSIDKITFLLENLLNNLTNPEENYETSHICEIENLSYIFHSLEVILQRYIKCKDILSQDTKNSQVEIKKSSITDMWRRKWNPNYKEDSVVEELTPRKCVLIKCNEVLNKFVVNCMDGYSLVAFAALNCFNLLQS